MIASNSAGKGNFFLNMKIFIKSPKGSDTYVIMEKIKIVFLCVSHSRKVSTPLPKCVSRCKSSSLWLHTFPLIAFVNSVQHVLHKMYWAVCSAHPFDVWNRTAVENAYQIIQMLLFRYFWLFMRINDIKAVVFIVLRYVFWVAGKCCYDIVINWDHFVRNFLGTYFPQSGKFWDFCSMWNPCNNVYLSLVIIIDQIKIAWYLLGYLQFSII